MPFLPLLVLPPHPPFLFIYGGCLADRSALYPSLHIGCCSGPLGARSFFAGWTQLSVAATDYSSLSPLPLSLLITFFFFFFPYGRPLTSLIPLLFLSIDPARRARPLVFLCSFRSLPSSFTVVHVRTRRVCQGSNPVRGKFRPLPAFPCLCVGHDVHVFLPSLFSSLFFLLWFGLSVGLHGGQSHRAGHL